MEQAFQQPMAANTQAKFADLPTATTERSTFDMSHAWKGTVDQSFIVPTLLQEVLPGDTFNIKTTAFIRLATPLKPIMDNLEATLHYFFVPNRLVWDNWQFFMGERKNTTDDPNTKSVPQADVDININNSGIFLDITLKNTTLQDYFGLPMFDPGPSDETPKLIKVNALPFRGYSLILNEWYRNQSLTSEIPITTGDGPDTISLQTYGYVARRMKKADYFTRAMPWPQKGDPVFIPLGGTAPVMGDGTPVRGKFGTSPASALGINNQGDVRGVKNEDLDGGISFLNMTWPTTVSSNGISAFADLTEASAVTINDLRTAFQIQRMLERDARSGTRYIEIILAHFNVNSPDARLQRPEYLGGSNANIMINPLASTVATVDAPQAELAAVGTGLIRGGINHSFVEHGFLFCLLSTRSDLTYQNGLNRHWSRQTRYDYYWPTLSHLGEQQILNQEIYYDFDNPTTNTQTWGYQERYAEYRYTPSLITGRFRSEFPTSLDVWHLAQDFPSLPPLNSFFIVDDPPMDRIEAVPSEPDYIVDVWHDMKASRVMPVYAVPGMVDHF